MTRILLIFTLAAVPAVALAGDHPAPAGDHPAPAAADQMKSLVAMCDASADARTARQAAESLYDRLGGYEKIHALTMEIVRLHSVNEDFRLMMKYVDDEALAKHVADFMSAGTGGTAEYTGRDMVSAHAHLELTNADFLSAGADVMQAMKNLGYGEEETQEVVCILVSMKDMVIVE